MKSLLPLVIVCLALSVGININLWLKLSATSDRSQPAQESYAPQSEQSIPSTKPAAPVEPSMVSHKTSLSDTDNDLYKAQHIQQIRQQIAANEYHSAKQAIQVYLRMHPQDIDYLILEAQWVQSTGQINEVLAEYYSLLDLALTTPQRAEVLSIIEQLTQDNIEKLKGIGSWDILATFLEPLWQFDPTRNTIILSLAEAYAHQQQEFLMENVLASLPQGDPSAERIRQIFQQQYAVAASADQSKNRSNDYERSAKLTPLGDHFVVSTRIGRVPFELMLDTGASTTVLTQNAFERIGRYVKKHYVGTYKVNTAGGQVDGAIYQLDHLFFGGFRVDSVAVVVLPMEEFDYADGLVGMNLLRQFDFKIDQQNAQLLLSRR
ncbi:retropepsin-like aspartic protease [Aliiglaciecola sp. LCG003]|uniref:retropepsin-like aspartic protease family protein n=1 Tax=Aliiglaciecola sp. LCG003 TaxID=3053655 RepID=UPI002574447A|nr:retropepsin-like aspartic protease [Aliiglaciecola sp. LCG003]WJG08308.1 retropepsin-like aspartic protease [Aliiglaciecola sp. LCG003]